MNRKIQLLAVLIVFGIVCVNAQNLDRISISSGGAAADNVNFVLGETFNFTVAQGGTISLETGTLASTENTGSDNNFTRVRQLAEVSQLAVYPNPATDYVTLANLNPQGFQNPEGLMVAVYDAYGKVVKKQAVETHGRVTLPINIDVTQLPAGMYFISVSDVSLKPVASAKFIKK